MSEYGKAGQHRAHATGDIESHASSRDDATPRRIECRYAADRKAIPPVRIGHRIGSTDNAGEHCDICDLRKDFVIHATNEVLVRIDDRRHAHPAGWLNPPSRRIDMSKKSRIHRDLG